MYFKLLKKKDLLAKFLKQEPFLIQVEDSYPVDDGMDNSTQIINADSGAKDNFTILIAKETETEVSFEQENEMNEPDTKVSLS